MKLAIMQPYFFPYIGYFQLIHAVDRFVVYDNVKYTKKGWINRNRLLQNGTAAGFTLPLANASDSLDIRERELSGDFRPNDLLNRVRGLYRCAPGFDPTFGLIERVLACKERNLFRFLHQSIVACCEHLGISTPILISSDVGADHRLHAQERVLAICQALGADTYVNAIGGLQLYSPPAFRSRHLELKFLRSRPVAYPQSGGNFVPWLSIIDVLMFNSVERVRNALLDQYDILTAPDAAAPEAAECP